MQITANWQNVTANQLKHVAAPSPGTTRRLEQTKAVIVADAFEYAKDQRDTLRYRQSDMTGSCLGATALTAVVAGFAGFNGYSNLALAAGCLGGAVALGTGYVALRSHNEIGNWKRFEGEMQTWAESAQQNLVRPGAAPGTEENHNFFEGGALENVFDVRRNGQVIERRAELASGLKLREDIATQTVTAETANGTKTFPRTSLELPTGASNSRAVLLKTFDSANRPVTQSLTHEGASHVKTEQGSFQVFPQTQMQYGKAGTQLPNGLVRFESVANRDDSWGAPEKLDALYFHPQLNGSDFQAGFAQQTEGTLTKQNEHGESTYRTSPKQELEVAGSYREPLEQALVSRRIPLPAGLELREDVATHQVSLTRDGQTLQTRAGELNPDAGTVTEQQGGRQVRQDLGRYPQVEMRVNDKLKIVVDTNDNIQATRGNLILPSQLLDGTAVRTDDLRIEIPVPRR